MREKSLGEGTLGRNAGRGDSSSKGGGGSTCTAGGGEGRLWEEKGFGMAGVGMWGGSRGQGLVAPACSSLDFPHSTVHSTSVLGLGQQ